MNENIESNLDSEFKKYLIIIRPHLGQFIEPDVIDLCNAWIKKLSECKEHEKSLRNKYILGLCFQLAKGTLEEPFLKPPPPNDLPPLHDVSSSDSSFTEVEYLVIDSENGNTKINNEKETPSQIFTDDSGINVSKKQIFEVNNNCGFENHFPQTNEYRNKSQSPTQSYNMSHINDGRTQCSECDDSYQFRANNLITKLRELKQQNVFLHNEITFLRQEAKREFDDSLNNTILKIDNTTSTENCFHENNTNFTSLKNQLQDVQQSRNNLIETVGTLQDKLDYFNEIKKHEIEEIEAKHKLEIIQLKTIIRDEVKSDYENKLIELKKQYENIILEIQCKTKEEIEQFFISKQKIIADKDGLLKVKEAEISSLEHQVEDLKRHQFSILNKCLNGTNESGNESAKTYDLEKRLYKMERTKNKCAKAYEAKVASLQREKHLAEYSLQLQLVKQRAQVLNEVTEQNQVELATALEQLENKYKSIVANVQATAVQRRVQDQIALESLIQSVCGVLPKGNTYVSHMKSTADQFSGKTTQFRSKERNLSKDRELETLCNSHRVDNVIIENKSFGDANVGTGYCLDSEKLQELFEKVHIPQRDVGTLPN